jgi:hypothetical protein
MNIRVGHTVGTKTTISVVRKEAWFFDDVIDIVPMDIIRRVLATDPLAQAKLEREARTQRDGVPGGMIGADIMDSYFRQWHAQEAITDDELDWLLNGTVG